MAGMPLLAFLVVAALAIVAVPARAADRPWRAPLVGETVRAPFAFDAGAPYARGARRGVDLHAAAGAPVRAVCAGVVSHAGPVPGWGPAVTLRCGALVATELGLAGAAAVRRGARVRAGAPLGRLGARGVLRLGARRAGARHGYVDPLALLGAEPGAPPAVAPPPVAPGGGRRRPAPPAAVAPRATVPARTPAPTDTRLAWPAWAGIALLAAGAGGGTFLARRRRHRAASRIPVQQRYLW
jgi:hypothetical protein